MNNYLFFISEHWPVVLAVLVSIAGITKWIHRVLQIKKLTLEVSILKDKLKEENKSPIEIATLEEIQKFASSTKDPRIIRNFIHKKSIELISERNKNNPDYDSFKETSIALDNVDGPLFEILTGLAPFQVSALIIYVFHEFLKYSRWTDSVFAKSLDVILFSIGVCVLLIVIIALIHDFVEWICERFF